MTSAPTAPTQTKPRQAAKNPLVKAWILWDAGNASFNAIMTTFVFAVYLTSSSFGSTEETSQALSLGLAIAGFLIALLAPVSGQRSDASGRRGFWLTVNSLLLVLIMALCFFVAPNPSYLWLGVLLLSAGNLVNEFAVVNYNALLPSISSKKTIGKVSGQGWAAGYLGGIVALGLVLLGFITPGLLGIPEEKAYNIRAVALFSALWALVFSLPLIIRLWNRPQKQSKEDRTDLLSSYRQLWATVVRLYRQAPKTLYFLLASAVFRDGLNGIFTFGGVLAAGSFGFSTNQVLLFAILGNLVAGAGSLAGGYLDDLLGPRRVIIFSLTGLVLAAIPLLLAPSQGMFWACGLTLCAFVGPAQSAARSYLGRLTEQGQEGEIYGLYSTTGRAASFLTPALFGLFVAVTGQQIWGILGIALVLLLGLLLMLPIKDPQAR